MSLLRLKLLIILKIVYSKYFKDLFRVNLKFVLIEIDFALKIKNKTSLKLDSLHYF
jgi:hypothetical protein